MRLETFPGASCLDHRCLMILLDIEDQQCQRSCARLSLIDLRIKVVNVFILQVLHCSYYPVVLHCQHRVESVFFFFFLLLLIKPILYEKWVTFGKFGPWNALNICCCKYEHKSHILSRPTPKVSSLLGNRSGVWWGSEGSSSQFTQMKSAATGLP